MKSIVMIKTIVLMIGAVRYTDVKMNLRSAMITAYVPLTVAKKKVVVNTPL
jgi:hypothetical protein